MSDVDAIMDRLAVASAEFERTLEKPDELEPPAVAAFLLEVKDLAADASAALRADRSPAAAMLRAVAETVVFQSYQALHAFAESLSDESKAFAVGQAAAWPLEFSKMLSALYRQAGYGGDEKPQA